MILSSQKLKHPARPIVPTFRPLYSAPWACAASSTTAMPCGSANARSASKSAGWPLRCTAMIAFVRPVIRSATLSGEMQNVRGLTSANTGVARWCSTGVAEAINVCAGTMTSSPGPTPSAASSVCIAVVPELVATHWSKPCQAANASSNAATAPPVSCVSLPELRTSVTASTSSTPGAGHGGYGRSRTFGPPLMASSSLSTHELSHAYRLCSSFPLKI